MSATQSASEEKAVRQEPAPLSRREIREREKAAEEAERNAALVDGPPPVRAAPAQSDSWLPPLFKEEEEVAVVKVEAPIVAAEYAREAPEGKHLNADQPKRIIIPPAPKTQFSPATGHSPVAVQSPIAPEQTSSGTVLKIVGLSVLYYALPIIGGIVAFVTASPSLATAP